MCPLAVPAVGISAADRTPFFCGSLPVAIAAHTASADVGWSVARW